MKDIFDWFDAGGTKAKLLAFAATAPDAETWLSGKDTEPDRGEEGKAKKTQAAALVDIGRRAELFHDADGKAFASIAVREHRETHPIRSRGFRRHLAHEYYLAYKKPPGSQATEDALRMLETTAAYEGEARAIPIRVAEHEGAIWIDLGGPDWDAVRVTRDGWAVVTSSAVPVRFRRGSDTAALPYPVAGGSLTQLRPFVNCTDGDWPLVVGWVLSAFCPRTSMTYPVLVFVGEQGSAKSTASRVVKRLTDPSTELLRTEQREVRDLYISATHSWVVALDNVSGLPSWLSDALCRLSTGGGFSTRSLYTDDEDFIFAAKRPIVLNGIGDVATRSDLLDRAMLVRFPTITEDKRKTEDDFWTAFDDARPHIFGALLDALAEALRRYADTRLDRLPRMADAARWVVAAEGVLPWPAGTFLAAMRESGSAANEVVIDAEVIVPALRKVASQGDGFTGKVSALLALINVEAGEAATRQRSWPKQPNGLSSRLRRIAPALRANGWTIDFPDEKGGRRTREVHLSVPVEPGEAEEGNPATGNPDPRAGAKTETAF